MTYLLPLALAGVLLAQQPAPPEIELDPPGTLPFAGVTLALPKGYFLQTPGDATIVTRALKIENDQPVLALTLSAFGQPANATLISFVNAARVKSGQVIRNLKLLKTGPLRMAGRPAEARMLAYDLRGVPTTAVRVYFLRPIPGASMQMGYILSVEGRRGRGREVLQLLGTVGNTLELSDPVRPISQKITALGRPIVSHKWGYSVRPPEWWKARTSPELDVVVMEQTDYLPRPRPPTLRLQVKPEAGSPETCAKASLKGLEEELTKQKADYKVVQQGPARMGGLEGHQFLVRQDIVVARGEDEKIEYTMLIAQRTVCASGNSYSLVAHYLTDRPEDVTGAMDAVAAGIEMTEPTTTAPTTAPAALPPSLPPVAPMPEPTRVRPLVPATAPTTRPARVVVPRYED